MDERHTSVNVRSTTISDITLSTGQPSGCSGIGSSGSSSSSYSRPSLLFPPSLKDNPKASLSAPSPQSQQSYSSGLSSMIAPNGESGHRQSRAEVTGWFHSFTMITFFFGTKLAYIFYPLSMIVYYLVVCLSAIAAGKSPGCVKFTLYLFSPLLLFLWWPIWMIVTILSALLATLGCGCCFTACYEDEELKEDTAIFYDMIFMPYVIAAAPLLGERE
eukprot:scaffold691_cov181-Ochromonas_danica.AAC.12